jgi:hypothetical protein
MDIRASLRTCDIAAAFMRGAWGLLALLLVFVAPQSRAQTVTGTILGTIKDSGGGALPNATVTAKNLETGISRTATTDSSGEFTVVSVPAGAYDVSVTAQGFKEEISKNQTLTVGAVLRVDMNLQVGTVEQQVLVTGEAPQVNTSNATISGLVDDVSIRELPLNGRDWIQLATIQPGVTTLDTASGGGYSGAGLRMFVAGSRSTQNVFRVDGLVVNDYSNNSPGNALGINMGVDSIREFTVLTNSFSAEYGRSAGGVVNSVLKSGTNQIHGSAFYFLRNSALDARNYFDPAQIPAFRRNQFGASVGGPIRKDKLFYFADYEGIREFQPASFATNTLSDDARNGLICNNTACTAKHQVTVAASIKPYLALFPHPTQPGPGDSGVFNFAGGAPGTDNYVIGKIDYQLNASNSFSVSYNFDQASIDAPDNYNNFKVLNKSRNQREIVTWQHVFSPTVLNTFRAGLNRIHQPQIFDHDGNAVSTDPSLIFNPGRTTMGVFSVPFLTSSYTPSGQDVHTREFDFTDPQLIDDVSWVKGRNNFRMGFSFESINTNIQSDSFPAGEWVFNSVSGFIQGLPDQYNSDLPGTDSIRGLRQKVFGVYFVDDFRVKPNLTLNLGLRYEPATVVKEANGKASFITNITQTPAQTVIGNPIYSNNTYKNFSPRVGLAWDPFKDGKTSVRAGFGVYDVQLTPALYLLRLDRSYPFYNQGAVNTIDTPTGNCPNGSCFPRGGLALLSPTSLFTMFIQQNPPTIYKMQWNVNVQRQITNTLTFTLGYVGAKGVHLPVAENDIDAVDPSRVTFSNGNYYFPVPAAPKINPNWSRIQSLKWDGFSKYNALQFIANKRVSHGLSVNGSYTYSHSIDNGGQEGTSNDFPGSMSNTYAFFPFLQNGPSDFDVRHSMTANFVYDFPSAHFHETFARLLTDGWEMTGIFSARSGLPFSLGIPNDQAGTGTFTSTSVHITQRPNFAPNAPGCNAATPQDAVTGNPNAYLNMACFPYPIRGQLGNLPRNSLRAPGLENFDFSLFKNNNFFGEKLKVQFRAEFFNILNHTNFQAQYVVPYSFNSTTGVGSPLSPSGTLANFWFGKTVTTSREIQFGMKFLF